MNVTLNDNDLRLVAQVAVSRCLQSMAKGMQNVNGGDHDPLTRHIIGAAGECATAKYLDIYWDGSVGKFRGMGTDLNGLEVRARSGDLPLIIRPHDEDSAKFVLAQMMGNIRNWRIVGWITGGEGKRIGKLVNMQGGQRYQVRTEQLHRIEQ